MVQNKLSSRVRSIVKSAVALAVLPVLFTYIMIAKPDYRVMNGLAHVVLPVAHGVGDLITWPVRVAARGVTNMRDLSRIRAENEELRAALDAAMQRSHECDIAIAENQHLIQQLDIVTQSPRGAIVADVTHDAGAFNHATLFINRGMRDGVAPGMAVVSMDNSLIGIVLDAGAHFARVRTLTDSDINIAVRVVGSEVYGFLAGNGSHKPSMGFFSDPEFQAAAGIKLVTSNISGVLPAGIFVGTMVNSRDVEIVSPDVMSRVMVLQFDADNEYK